MRASGEWVPCAALEDVSGDVRKPMKMMDPKLPTQTEVDEHNLTHLPFRSWCPQCVKGRGRAADHVAQAREDGMMEIHSDYCFLTTADSQEKYTLLVAREKSTRMTMATLVPMKGSSSEFPVKRLLAFVKELGGGRSPNRFQVGSGAGYTESHRGSYSQKNSAEFPGVLSDLLVPVEWSS